MTETKKYTGSCHCGAVRYEVALDLSQPVISCNCSMCGRAGSLLTFVPSAEFQLLSGEGSLTDYQFNHHVIHHQFCTVCGCAPFGSGKGQDGKEMLSVNLRCVPECDLSALEITEYDGASR